MTIDEIMSKTLEQWRQRALTRKRLFLEQLKLLEDSTEKFSKDITYFAANSSGHCFGFTDAEDKPKFYGSGVGWVSHQDDGCWFLGMIQAESLLPTETLTSVEEYQAYKEGPLQGLSITLPIAAFGDFTTQEVSKC